MKKLLTSLIALTVLLSCSACGNDSSKTAGSSSAEQSTTVTELTTTELTTELTTERTTVTTASQAVTELTGTGDTTAKNGGSGSQKAEIGQFTQALYDRIKNHKGQVKMTMRQEAEDSSGARADIQVVVAGKKLRFEMSFPELFSLTVISDGTASYLLDTDSKLYAKMDQDDDTFMNDGNTPLLSEEGPGKYLGTGKAAFKGKQTTYEEYQPESDEGTENDIRYFYDDKGNLIGFASGSKDDRTETDFSIRFEDQIDSKLFELPAGYKEGTKDVVVAAVYGKMFAAMFGGLDLSGLTTSVAGT